MLNNNEWLLHLGSFDTLLSILFDDYFEFFLMSVGEGKLDDIKG
jgi:hypothetical protein